MRPLYSAQTENTLRHSRHAGVKAEGCFTTEQSVLPDCPPPDPFAAAAASEASGPGFACSSQRSLKQRTPSPLSAHWLRHSGMKGNKEIQKSTDREQECMLD